MFFKSYVEYELKLRQRLGHDFRPELAALGGLVTPCFVGSRPPMIHHYFDLDDALFTAGASLRLLRRKSGGLRYNFKRLLEIRSGMLVRREWTIKNPDPLDLVNPFHQRLPLVVELLEAIAPSLEGRTPGRLCRFRPRVVLRCSRAVYRSHDYKYNIEKSLFICIDHIECFDACQCSAPYAGFSELEIEVEVNRHHPSAYERLASCRDKLARGGYITCTDSKYQNSVNILKGRKS